MDVIKVFTEEPLGLEALVLDDDPDARRRDVPSDTLEAFLSQSPPPYARAYLAGTALGPPRRVGLTAVSETDAWLRPLVTWAAGRPWTAWSEGTAQALTGAGAVDALRRPGHVRALTLGPARPGALAAVGAEGGQRRDRLPALRALLDGGAAVLFPEPAHDSWDWSLFALAPLRDPLVAAFRKHPAQARRLVAPYQRARGEHTFYLEQWTLDDLPEWVEEI